jgi:hypothetical protein
MSKTTIQALKTLNSRHKRKTTHIHALTFKTCSIFELCENDPCIGAANTPKYKNSIGRRSATHVASVGGHRLAYLCDKCSEDWAKNWIKYRRKPRQRTKKAA